MVIPTTAVLAATGVRDLQLASVMRLRLGRHNGAGSAGTIKSIVVLAMTICAGMATSNCSRDVSPTAPAPDPGVITMPHPARSV